MSLPWRHEEQQGGGMLNLAAMNQSQVTCTQRLRAFLIICSLLGVIISIGTIKMNRPTLLGDDWEAPYNRIKARFNDGRL